MVSLQHGIPAFGRKIQRNQRSADRIGSGILASRREVDMGHGFCLL